MISPFTVVLSGADKCELVRRVARLRNEVRDARRARIVQAASRGTPNARQEGVHVDTVRKWRSRFTADGLGGLRDLPRSGRPPVFDATAVAEVKALACQLPAETGTPLSRWLHASCRPCTAATRDYRPPARPRRVEFEYPRRHPRLPRRLRRPPRESDRPMRADHRDRTVHRTRRAGHDHRALRLGPPGVLGRG